MHPNDEEDIPHARGEVESANRGYQQGCLAAQDDLVWDVVDDEAVEKAREARKHTGDRTDIRGDEEVRF